MSTIIIDNEHADYGMPVSARVHVPSLRALVVTAVSSPDTWVLDVPCDQRGEGSVFADGTVDAGATPGIPAWSPPT